MSEAAIRSAAAVRRIDGRSERWAPLLLVAVIVAAIYLESVYPVRLITVSNVMALSWLGLGPFLIRDAVRITRNFLESYRPFFHRESTADDLFELFATQFRSGWRVFGLPWSIVVTAVIVGGQYQSAPVAVRAWAILAFGPLLLLSGIGFYGVICMIRLIKTFAHAGVLYRPYHPDHFGGLASVGSYAVRGALYFSSGALALPLAFEIIRALGTSAGLSAIAYLVTATFIAFVCAAFAIPVIDVKRLADAERVRVSVEARARLDQLIASYRKAPEHDEKLARQAEMCFEMECAELEKLREYPYDLSVLAELITAIAVPIAVVVLQEVLK